MQDAAESIVMIVVTVLALAAAVGVWLVARLKPPRVASRVEAKKRPRGPRARAKAAGYPVSPPIADVRLARQVAAARGEQAARLQRLNASHDQWVQLALQDIDTVPRAEEQAFHHIPPIYGPHAVRSSSEPPSGSGLRRGDD